MNESFNYDYRNINIRYYLFIPENDLNPPKTHYLSINSDSILQASEIYSTNNELVKMTIIKGKQGCNVFNKKEKVHLFLL